jgi:hypothetical protein
MNMRKDKTMRNTTKNTTETAEWLTAKTRNGRRRIETFGWKRLAAIYDANRPGSKIRKAINAEARRCGYTPSTILTLNAD